MMEIELKLLIDPADVAAFRRHSLLKEYAIAKPRLQQLASVYFDTPDLYLWRNQMALRVRNAGKTWVQTLKGGGHMEAGLHQRDEWESGIGGPNPDLDALISQAKRDSEWKKILSIPALANRLEPVFTTRFRRTTWLLRFASGEEVELALDQGAVEHNAAQAPINEIELELKFGKPARLFDFALELQNSVPLRVGTLSKAERGYALYAPEPQAAIKAQRIRIPREMTVEQGFQAIVGNCLEQVQGNAIVVEHGSDEEGVHQMRVGIRRLRAALGLFREVAPCPSDLRADLGWLRTELGAARDWDVFSGGTLSSVTSANPEEKELAQLQQVAMDMARENRQRAAASVSSVRYSRLLLSLGGWVRGARWRGSAAQAEREVLDAGFETFAVKLLERSHRKLLKRGKRLSTATPPERHKVRIAAKKVRYSAEFFRSLYPAGQLRPYLKALTVLQDVLGRLNDTIVADVLLRRIAQMRPDQAQNAGFIEGYLAARVQKEVRKLGKPWRQFASLNVPKTTR